MKTSKEIRKAFLDYWKENPRNFKEVPNMSLVPNVDSTLLFVNSGMFPLAPYLGGQPHPLGTRLVDIQRCLRTNYDEMLEIGDNRHTLMFEMLGDWSLGDFFKEEQIPWILNFWVNICGLDPKRIYVTVFEGDDDAPIDTEAIEIWKKAFASYGVEAELSPDITDIPKDLAEGETWKYRIFKYPKKKNWWERAHSPNELGGPTSEMFYDMGKKERDDDKYHVNDDSGRFIEIGNNVFMQYRLDQNLKWQTLSQKNIDFGGGFERVVMIVQGKNDIFETDIFEPILNKISEISKKNYKDNNVENEWTRYFRILADHSRAATFILADGVLPGNKDQGYILRRFIRRLVRYGMNLGITTEFTKELAEVVIETMNHAYPHLLENREIILKEIEKEEKKFNSTLERGLKEIHKLKASNEKLDGKKAFYLYETFGFPVEMIYDELGIPENEIETIQKEYEIENDKHRTESRAGAEQKFKGGLADASVETTKLHTAHHLLLAAMQKLVNKDIKQKGSNITAERLRMDFNFDRKLTEEEVKKIEDLVNEKIKDELPVIRFMMKKESAEKLGAQMEFGQKYPDEVTIYFIMKPLTREQELASQMPMEIIQKHTEAGESFHIQDQMIGIFKNNSFSMEFCGGPHVSNTREIGIGNKRFKITGQESVGAGVRRIKASLV